ncbi:MAG: hypothetical protein CME61_03460, partial [Halobacteriovoraceae bacterium]|nr:hypothetical protein [Halobacteriovoraceae bacterium]
MSKRFLFYFQENCEFKELRREVTLADAQSFIILNKENFKNLLSDRDSPFVFMEFGSDPQKDERFAAEIKSINPKVKLITSTFNETRDHLLSFIKLKVETYLIHPVDLDQIKCFATPSKGIVPSSSDSLFSKN